MPTDNLDLSLLMPAQAQKHVTVNEALLRLDKLVQVSVLDKDLITPPIAPIEGDAYIVAGPMADQSWAGYEGHLAYYSDSSWSFIAPKIGWGAYVQDESLLYACNDTGWAPVSTPAEIMLNPVEGDVLGVNATADSTNRLTVASSGVLFTHASADMRLSLNKAADIQTSSVVFQSQFNGHAEFGLTGDNDFHMKVSPDGATFYEGIIIDRATGRVKLPNTQLPLLNVKINPSVDSLAVNVFSSLSPAIWTDIIDDNVGGYDASTGIYTIAETGNYMVFASADGTGDVNANFIAIACVLGTATDLSTILGFGRANVRNNTAMATLGTPLFFNQGDTIKFYYYTTSATVTLIPAQISFFGLFKLL